VISVGATNSSNTRASFSNTGPSLDVVAPGVDIVQEAYAQDRDGKFKWAYWYSSGTSMAAPHVAAAAALLLAKDPNLTSDEIRALLTSTSRDFGAAGFDEYYGFGLIQVASAIAALDGSIEPPPPVEPPPPEEPAVELIAPSLSFVSNGDGGVTLSWSDESTSESGYRVYRSKYNERKRTWSNPSVIQTLGENVTSATDAPGSGTYTYRVGVFSSESELLSNEITMTFASTKGGGGGGGGGNGKKR